MRTILVNSNVQFSEAVLYEWSGKTVRVYASVYQVFLYFLILAFLHPKGRIKVNNTSEEIYHLTILIPLL